MSYYPEPESHIRDKVKVVLDLSKYASKKELKHATSIDTSDLAAKKDLIRDIMTLFEKEEEDYYKPERVNNFWNNIYIQYESNGDNNRNLSLN